MHFASHVYQASDCPIRNHVTYLFRWKISWYRNNYNVN